MAVRSKTLFLGEATSTPAVKYTCPAAETTLVKWVSISNPLGAANNRVIIRHNDGTNDPIVFAHTFASAETLGFEVWWVLMPGHQLSCNGTLPTAVLDLALYGAQLEGVAD